MTDMTNVVAKLAKAAPDASVRFRRGSIVSVQSDGTCTVTIGGGSQQVAGVKVLASCCPIPGASCWLSTDGRDLFVMGTLSPNGPAWASMRQSAAQSIANGSFTALDWTSRTEVTSVGLTVGNSGFTCVVPGLYQVNFSAVFAANNTGQRHAYIQHNGSTEFQGFSTNAPGTGDICRMNITTIIKLAVGDTVNGVMYQSSGAALSTQIGTGANILRATWLGPSV